MARIKARPVFDPAQPMEVRKSFRAAGRSFRPGEEFPWKKLAITQRRVQQMYEGGQLGFGPNDDGFDLELSTDEDTFVAADEFVFSGFDAETDREPDNLNDMTMADLKRKAKAMGAPVKRSKADQIEAIIAHSGG